MNNDEILVKVEGVSKKYCKDLKRSLRYGLQELAGELVLKRKPTDNLRRHEFWALQDVNFELRRGEAFGIIGVNGSGKTTLLKMMQGLLKPTRGTITMRGRVGALISLGAGFQPLLTGRENIYVNASILRVPKRQVDKRMKDILAFADIGDFIDAPIKTYSSGMRGRLGFAVATHLIDPDVLLLDEVLATGDWKFKDRCFERMEEIVSSGATVVFVSHLVPKVEKFCNRAMLLHKGVVKGIGPSTEICEMFYDLPEIEIPTHPKERRQKLAKALKKRAKAVIKQEKSIAETEVDIACPQVTHPQAAHHHPPARELGKPGEIGETGEKIDELLEIELLDHQGSALNKCRTLDALIVQIHLLFNPWPENIKLIVQILTPGDELSISHFSSTFSLTTGQNTVREYSTIECKIPELTLREGKYRVSVTAIPIDQTERQRSRSRMTSLVTLKVKDRVEQDQTMAITTKKSPGLVYMPVHWSVNSQILVQSK